MGKTSTRKFKPDSSPTEKKKEKKERKTQFQFKRKKESDRTTKLRGGTGRQPNSPPTVRQQDKNLSIKEKSGLEGSARRKKNTMY